MGDASKARRLLDNMPDDKLVEMREYIDTLRIATLHDRPFKCKRIPSPDELLGDKLERRIYTNIHKLHHEMIMDAWANTLNDEE